MLSVKLSNSKIKDFQQEILAWYKKNKRVLPWRQTRDPYKILVSEIMSQQTQLSRVVPKYIEWMEAFPTVESLAKTSTREVLLYWSGLGYNRRGLYLKKCAEEVVKNGWPTTEKELRELPGIGEYTAKALLCFAFNEQVAVVDTNVRKVILTKFQNTKRKTQKLTNKEIQEIAEQLLPKGKAYEWNQALMDYAAIELRQCKIPVPKQSKFQDSDRYYRGQILKSLIKSKKSSQTELFKPFSNIPTMDKERFAKILQGLVKDKLCKKQGSSFLV